MQHKCRPLFYSTPYDQTTVWGYGITLALECSGISTLCLLLATENVYFIGICDYSKGLLQELNIYFNEVDDIIERNLSNADIRIRKLLITMIRTHVEIFE